MDFLQNLNANSGALTLLVLAVQIFVTIIIARAQSKSAKEQNRFAQQQADAMNTQNDLIEAQKEIADEVKAIENRSRERAFEFEKLRILNNLDERFHSSFKEIQLALVDLKKEVGHHRRLRKIQDLDFGSVYLFREFWTIQRDQIHQFCSGNLDKEKLKRFLEKRYTNFLEFIATYNFNLIWDSTNKIEAPAFVALWYYWRNKLYHSDFVSSESVAMKDLVDRFAQRAANPRIVTTQEQIRDDIDAALEAAAGNRPVKFAAHGIDDLMLPVRA